MTIYNNRGFFKTSVFKKSPGFRCRCKKKSCPNCIEQLHALEAYRKYSDLGGEL